MIVISLLPLVLVIVYTQITTAAEGEFECNLEENGAEAILECPLNTHLLKQFASRSQFFSDALGAGCSKIDEVVYEDEGQEYVFPSEDGGLTLNAECPNEHDVIVSFKLCMMDAHIQAIVLKCHALKDPDRIVEKFEASSDPNHFNVNCGDNDDVGMQGIQLMDAGDGVITKVILNCFTLLT